MNRYSVLLFARLKDLAGASAIDVELPDGARIADLRRRLGEQQPTLAALLPHCLFAVDGAYADESVVLSYKAEIACIPPVSGG
jgi:molybdopterin synthase sulfur carrier subunit